jgi:hypothetical protein
MTTIQEYFDQTQNKEKRQIFLDGEEVGKLEGNELNIESFNNLTHIFIKNFPNLTKLIIKDCTKLKTLEYGLEAELSVFLHNSTLTSIKSSVSVRKPIIVYQSKVRDGFCWNCAMHAVSIGGVVILLVVVFYLLGIIKMLKKHLKRRWK